MIKHRVHFRVHFLHADKHQNFYKLGLLFLMEVARYVQSTQNRKLVILLQYVKKRVLLLCSLWCKTFRYFTGVQSCLLLLVSLFIQIVKIFCLNTGSQLLYNNYVGRSCLLSCLCSKLIFFKRSRVHCTKSTYARQTNQKKLVSGLTLVIQIIPPKFLQECTSILQLKVYIIYVVRKLVGHPMWQGDIK